MLFCVYLYQQRERDMILIINNKNNRAGLGDSKWFAYNNENGKLIGCNYKYEAQQIINNPQEWDI